MVGKLKNRIVKITDYFYSMALTRFLVFGYLMVILTGTFLLMLPVSTRVGHITHLNEALFTSTSATCVTGLVLSDTYTHWSTFGQLIIMLLIQIGGVGFMTIAIFALSFTKKKIGLKQRFTMQESVGAQQVGGIVKITKFMLLASLGIEGTGAIILCFRFCPMFGFFKGLYFSVFHSISAFCNAGFDLLGSIAPGSSIITQQNDYLINIVFMLLIAIGGLGFLVWRDIIAHKFHFHSYRLQTKIVLVTTAGLILGGALCLFIFEYISPAFDGMSTSDKVLASFFQSVSARTAGFETVDLTKMNESGQFIMIVLMFIGGSSGSTAGGIKTTTVAVLAISVISVFKKKKSLEAFNRRLEEDVVHNACCVFVFYLSLAGISAIIISFIEKIRLLPALFECVSAIATVGLTLGVTPTLKVGSQLIIVGLMFVGRIGGLTVLLALGNKSINGNSKYPVEKISVG